MKFSNEELDFIRKDLGIDAKQEETDEDLLVRIQDAAFEIEVEESNRLEELSARGKIAVDLVTKLGNEQPSF